MLIFLNLFSTQNSLSVDHRRLKRDATGPSSNSTDDRRHYLDMLHDILTARTNSVVLSDCTINMATDGVYRIPKQETLSYEFIRLAEESFRIELDEIRRLTFKIRSKLESSSSSSFDQIRKVMSLDLRLLLASQIRIKQVDLLTESNDNGPLQRIKYFRLNSSIIDIIEYENVGEEIDSNSMILQTYTVANAREALNDKQYKELLLNKHWWLGPVLCTKNVDERFLMAHIFPLSNR